MRSFETTKHRAPKVRLFMYVKWSDAFWVRLNRAPETSTKSPPETIDLARLIEVMIGSWSYKNW